MSAQANEVAVAATATKKGARGVLALRFFRRGFSSGERQQPPTCHGHHKSFVTLFRLGFWSSLRESQNL